MLHHTTVAAARTPPHVVPARPVRGYGENVKPLLVALAGAFAALFAVALPAEAAYPIHGIVLGAAGPHAIVARTRGVTGQRPAGVATFAVDGAAAALTSGTEIDALVDGTRGRLPHLRDVVPAQAFVAGLPSEQRVRVMKAGDPMPDASFVDQNGRVVRLSDWHGKTTVISFVYTRCPLAKVCPAISGKFAYLQRKIDPAKTHLAIITLDPVFDSPSVLQRYGTKFEADASRWSLLTGEDHAVKGLLDRLAISPLQDGPGDFIHDEALVIVDKTGIIKSVIPSPDWDPDGMLAEVRDLSGESSNPLRRFLLSAESSIATFCGGYSIAGIVVEIGAFLITFVVFGAVLAWFFWRVFFGDGAPSRKRG